MLEVRGVVPVVRIENVRSAGLDVSAVPGSLCLSCRTRTRSRRTADRRCIRAQILSAGKQSASVGWRNGPAGDRTHDLGLERPRQSVGPTLILSKNQQLTASERWWALAGAGGVWYFVWYLDSRLHVHRHPLRDASQRGFHALSSAPTHATIRSRCAEETGSDAMRSISVAGSIICSTSRTRTNSRSFSRKATSLLAARSCPSMQ